MKQEMGRSQPHHSSGDETRGWTQVKPGYSGIQEAFAAIPPGKPTHWLVTRPATISMPRRSWGDPNWHQQGIQKTAQGGWVVSGSAPDVGYLYFSNPAHEIVNVVTPEAWTEPPDPQGMNHLGGLQVAGDLLAVGYERYQCRRRGTSKIVFYDIADIGAPVALDHLTITRARQGETAGAVGLIQLEDRWLVLVANWDAMRIDGYTSNAADLRHRGTHFGVVPEWSWSAATHGLAPGSIDRRWGAYQNINLFGEAGVTPRPDELWFVATHAHWADLYHLDLGAGDPMVTKVGKKRFAGGRDFSQAAGLYRDNTTGCFEVYAAEAHLRDGTTSRVDCWR